MMTTILPLTLILSTFAAKGPAPELAQRLQLFGQFVGDWVTDFDTYLPNGVTVHGTGEVHFGWILSGTAIQDVWIGRVANPPAGYPAESAGTTLRIPDPAGDGWLCEWIHPRTGIQHLKARRIPTGILLETQTPDGRPEKWFYSDITPNSFIWHSEETRDGGKTWVVTQVIRAHRAK